MPDAYVAGKQLSVERGIFLLCGVELDREETKRLLAAVRPLMHYCPHMCTTGIQTPGRSPPLPPDEPVQQR